MNSRSFLPPAELEELTRPGRRVDRRMVEADRQTSFDAAGSATSVEPFHRTIGNRLQALLKRDGTWLECQCIQVEEADGMSWCAETVRNELGERFTQFRQMCFGAQLQDTRLPLISQLVGARAFLRAAVATNVTDQYRILKPRVTWAVLLGSVVLGPLLTFFLFVERDLLGAAGGSMGRTMTSPAFLATSMATVVLGLLGKQLAAMLLTQSTPAKIESFLTDLEAKQGHNHYQSFIEQLATELANDDLFPRAVIVDDVERLDYTTRAVLRRYLEKYAGIPSGVELWVVFERRGGDALSNWILSPAGRAILPQTQILTLLPLTTTERKQLAETLGFPERADYSVVKTICAADTNLESVQSVLAPFHGKDRLSPQNRGDLELLLLLSVTSNPGNHFLDDEFLQRVLTEKTGLRAAVLAKFLSIDNTKEIISWHLSGIPDRFSSWLRKKVALNWL